MKVSGMFDQNLLHIFTKKSRKTHSNGKCSHSLTMVSKVKVIEKKSSSQGQKNCCPSLPPPPKKIPLGLPSNWCAAEMFNRF